MKVVIKYKNDNAVVMNFDKIKRASQNLARDMALYIHTSMTFGKVHGIITGFNFLLFVHQDIMFQTVSFQQA